MAQIGFGNNNLGFFQQPLTQGAQGIQGLQGLQGIEGIQGIQGIQGAQGLPGGSILVYDSVASPTGVTGSWIDSKLFTAASALSISQELLLETFHSNLSALNEGKIRFNVSDGTLNESTIEIPFQNLGSSLIHLSIKRALTGLRYTVSRIQSAATSPIDSFAWQANLSTLDPTQPLEIKIQVFVNTNVSPIPPAVPNQSIIQYYQVKLFNQ